MYTIEIVQGDTSPVYKFQRKDIDGNVITTPPLKMWLTVKADTKTDKALIQKTLGNGIEYNKIDNFYRFQLLPQDTAKLCYGSYGFDIAILDDNGNKFTLLNNGVLNVVEHYTKQCNEV